METMPRIQNGVRRPPPWRIDDIIDGRSLRIQLTTAHFTHQANETKERAAVLDILHRAMFRGRMIAQERLESGADGLDTAILLSAVMDEVLEALFDFTTTHKFRARNPTEGERMAVFAVGGYGRSALAPSSDVDLLFVRTYKQTAWAESVIEYMLYMLWDLGLKVGHAFRTVDECIKLAKQDVTIRTAVLDRRLLFGDSEIAAVLDKRFQADIVATGGAQFVADKLAERDKRIAREGHSRYRVEPNIKDGKGGLRDLQTLFWLARFIHGGESFDEVLANAAFTTREAATFRREARFLWTVRCHLHYLTGRLEDRLSFDVQPEMAARMGFRDRNGMTAVERFMKRYFLAATQVGALTRILCARLEAGQQKKPSGLLRFLPTPEPKPLSDERFVVDAGRVTYRDRNEFVSDPKNLLRLFKVADGAGLDIHPSAMSAVRDTAGRLITPEVREDAEAQDLFLSIATSKHHPGTALKLMNETGLLGRFLPEFGRIVGQTQFNMYHQYTVDEHTLLAVSIMNEIELGEFDQELPVSTRNFGKLHNRRALYLAMLLHDTGKGQGDQQIEGAKSAKEACLRLGLSEQEAELVAWLVGHHLEMSDTAQRRDMSDPKTMADFAALVGDMEHLRLLLILTVCDIRAVGPDIWNGWKGQLLRELFEATEAIFKANNTDERSIRGQLSRRADKSRNALESKVNNLPEQLESLEDGYWTTFDAPTHSWHADVLETEPKHQVCAGARINVERGTTEVLLWAPDRKGLFVDVCSVFTDAGANILSARLFPGADGYVLDVFDVQDASSGPFAEGSEDRLEQLIASLLIAAKGKLDPSKTMGEQSYSTTRRQAAFIVLPEVEIDHDAASNATLVQLTGRDRPGLMRDIAVCLREHDLSIHSAHAESYGMRVHDVFYVIDQTSDGFQEQKLKKALLKILDQDQPDAPRTPAGELAQAIASDDR